MIFTIYFFRSLETFYRLLVIFFRSTQFCNALQICIVRIYVKLNKFSKNCSMYESGRSGRMKVDGPKPLDQRYNPCLKCILNAYLDL